MSLTIKGLTKVFENKQIFSNFSYSFSGKGLYVITGDSGIGKTTLLRIIAGLDEKYTGSVLEGGFDNVSFSFQEYRLFEGLTALENITEVVFEKADKNDIEKAKSLLFSLGFKESELTLFPSELSGGMKQRVSLARAFLKPCSILILDEPTKELDDELCKKVRDLMKEEAKKRLVLTVTHSETDIKELGGTVLNLNQKK